MALRIAIALGLAISAIAQPGKLELHGDVGTAAFLDDSRDQHLLLGASLRAYLTERLSCQPEYQFLNGQGHYDSIFLASVAYDLRPPTRPVVPYLLIGAGLQRYLHPAGTSPRISGLASNRITASASASVTPCDANLR